VLRCRAAAAPRGWTTERRGAAGGGYIRYAAGAQWNCGWRVDPERLHGY
jgi:hypothetical protein